MNFRLHRNIVLYQSAVILVKSSSKTIYPSIINSGCTIALCSTYISLCRPRVSNWVVLIGCILAGTNRWYIRASSYYIKLSIYYSMEGINTSGWHCSFRAPCVSGKIVFFGSIKCSRGIITSSRKIHLIWDYHTAEPFRAVPIVALATQASVVASVAVERSSYQAP